MRIAGSRSLSIAFLPRLALQLALSPEAVKRRHIYEISEPECEISDAALPSVVPRTQPYKPMKTSGTPKSGKLGNRVAYTSRFGQCERRHVRPRSNPTAAQLRATAAFGHISKLWNTLSDEQAERWTRAAQTVHSKPRAGKSGPLTGQMFFNRLNRNQALLGLPLLLTPPAPPTFSTHTVGALHITRAHGKPVLKLEVPKLPAGHILVYASRPHNRGRRYCDKFTYLGPLPAPTRAQSDITRLYAARFGFPRPGTRVFVRTFQQIEGCRSLPRQTHALVPALSSRFVPAAISPRPSATLA